MLGLGASLSNDEAYAKGERYRERYHKPEGTYDSTNPIGRTGIESDYIGDFSDASHDDNYVAIDATLTIDGAAFKIVADDSLGHAKIGISTVPGVSYKLVFDITAIGESNSGEVHAGNTLTANAYGDTGNLQAGIGRSLTFTSITHYTLLSFFSNIDGELIKYDNISLKES